MKNDWLYFSVFSAFQNMSILKDWIKTRWVMNDLIDNYTVFSTSIIPLLIIASLFASRHNSPFNILKKGINAFKNMSGMQDLIKNQWVMTCQFYLF